MEKIEKIPNLGLEIQNNPDLITTWKPYDKERYVRDITLTSRKLKK